MNAPRQPARRFTISQFATSRQLPTLPEVALRLLEIAQQEEPDYKEISRIVRTDPVVSGKILKTVNSALFGFRQKIETIEQALPKLGLTLLRTLILSFHLSRHETHQSKLKPILQDLWRSSLTQASFAEMIAEKIEGADPATYFLAAMLQDIGILAMISEAPEEYMTQVLDRAKFPQVTTAEKSLFGFNHVDVTTAILEIWGMGDCFGDALQHHHDRVVPPGQSRDSRLAIALQAANLATEMMFSSRSSATPLAAAVAEWACFLKNRLGLDEAQAEEMVDEINARVGECSAQFSFDIGNGVCADRVVCDAKEMLQEITLRNQMKMMEQSNSRKNKANEEELYRDYLSGLFNRRYMNDKLSEQLEMCIQKCQPIAFLFLDVDKFKTINDQWGHAVGDKAIQHVANWLTHSIRPHDLAIRIGGDEFLVVLQKLSESDFERIAARIGGEIPPLVIDSDDTFAITLSVGGAFYQPEKGDSPDPNWLIDQADQMMYCAKRNGGHSRSIQKFVGMQSA